MRLTHQPGRTLILDTRNELERLNHLFSRRDPLPTPHLPLDEDLTRLHPTIPILLPMALHTLGSDLCLDFDFIFVIHLHLTDFTRSSPSRFRLVVNLFPFLLDVVFFPKRAIHLLTPSFAFICTTNATHRSYGDRRVDGTCQAQLGPSERVVAEMDEGRVSEENEVD